MDCFAVYNLLLLCLREVTAMKKLFLEWLKHFRVMLILVAASLVAFFIVRAKQINRLEDYEAQHYDSPNTERVYGDRRVFDYSDSLTDEQEQQLEDYIHEAELETCCDIVIVSLNESLKGYAPEYTAKYEEYNNTQITPDKYTMIYADKFWEDNRFGYDAAQVLDGTTDTGDGVILVDNIFREPETGEVYTWLGTTGIVEDRFSVNDIDSVQDDFYVHVEDDYFRACMDFVDSFVEHMSDAPHIPSFFWHPVAWFIGIIIWLSYYFSNKNDTDNNMTVSGSTYVVGGEPEFLQKEDILLRTEESTVYVPPSSYSGGSSHSGGGGHHTSGGGGSHGGGGHHR